MIPMMAKRNITTISSMKLTPLSSRFLPCVGPGAFICRPSGAPRGGRTNSTRLGVGYGMVPPSRVGWSGSPPLLVDRCSAEVPAVAPTAPGVVVGTGAAVVEATAWEAIA